MDITEEYRKTIKSILTDYVSVPYSRGNIESKLIVSNDENNYLVMTAGWQNKKKGYMAALFI